MISPSKAKVAPAISIWVRGYPVRESEMSLAANGEMTLNAYRWQNAVCWAVALKGEKQTLLYPYLQCRNVKPKALQVSYRFTGVQGDPAQYVKLTQAGIAVAYRIRKTAIKTASATCEPGEPGCWLELQEVS